MGSVVLSATLPASWSPGSPWADGVPYASVGDLSAEEPPPGPAASCPAPLPGASTDGGLATDAESADVVDGGGASDAAAVGLAQSGDGGIPFALNVPLEPRPTSMALRTDVPFLYVADGALPVIHVFDLRDPANPVELPPLLATSVADTARRVPVGGLAISPPTHDYKTYLYAVDAGDGSLMVFDITDPMSLPQTPRLRPHSELNPLAPLDRLTFAAPVAAVAFVRHDWPLPASASQPSDTVHQYTGLLCNPNPHAMDRGVNYRANQAGNILAQSTVEGLPLRLRGVFAFATLSNGNIVTIDVDDWDAPCRRPDPMRAADPRLKESADTVGMTGLLDLPEPLGDAMDVDPYHAPSTFLGTGAASVTLESFFPVSAPHRPRSAFLLLNDPSGGVHVPTVVGTPQLFDFNGSPVVVSGVVASRSLMLPTALPNGFIDPTYITPTAQPDPSLRTASLPATDPTGGADAQAALAPPPAVRVSFDDPTAHQDQDWTVTYEGALPTVSGIERGPFELRQLRDAPVFLPRGELLRARDRGRERRAHEGDASGRGGHGLVDGARIDHFFPPGLDGGLCRDHGRFACVDRPVLERGNPGIRCDAAQQVLGLRHVARRFSRRGGQRREGASSIRQLPAGVWRPRFEPRFSIWPGIFRF